VGAFPFLAAFLLGAAFFAFVVFLVPLVLGLVVFLALETGFLALVLAFVMAGFVAFVFFLVAVTFLDGAFLAFFVLLLVLFFGFEVALALVGFLTFFASLGFLAAAALALGLSLNDCFICTNIPDSTPLRIAVRSALWKVLTLTSKLA